MSASPDSEASQCCCTRARVLVSRSVVLSTSVTLAGRNLSARAIPSWDGLVPDSGWAGLRRLGCDHTGKHLDHTGKHLLSFGLAEVRPSSADLGLKKYGVAMACRITELVLDCRNPELLADFWCQVLGYVVLETCDDGSVEIGPAGTDPDDPGLTLVLSLSTEPKQTKLRLHFDVNAVDRSQDEELRRLFKLGARTADVGQWIAPAFLEAPACRIRLTYHAF